MMKTYKLVGHDVVPCSWEEASATYSENRQVAVTDIGEERDEICTRVSTIFLMVDHRYGGHGPPLLFETMIFGGPHNDYQQRCSTWDEAIAMHAKAVALVKGGQ